MDESTTPESTVWPPAPIVGKAIFGYTGDFGDSFRILGKAYVAFAFMMGVIELAYLLITLTEWVSNYWHEVAPNAVLAGLRHDIDQISPYFNRIWKALSNIWFYVVLECQRSVFPRYSRKRTLWTIALWNLPYVDVLVGCPALCSIWSDCGNFDSGVRHNNKLGTRIIILAMVLFFIADIAFGLSDYRRELFPHVSFWPFFLAIHGVGDAIFTAYNFVEIVFISKVTKIVCEQMSIHSALPNHTTTAISDVPTPSA